MVRRRRATVLSGGGCMAPPRDTGLGHCPNCGARLLRADRRIGGGLDFGRISVWCDECGTRVYMKFRPVRVENVRASDLSGVSAVLRRFRHRSTRTSAVNQSSREAATSIRRESANRVTHERNAIVRASRPSEPSFRTPIALGFRSLRAGCPSSLAPGSRAWRRASGGARDDSPELG